MAVPLTEIDTGEGTGMETGYRSGAAEETDSKDKKGTAGHEGEATLGTSLKLSLSGA